MKYLICALMLRSFLRSWTAADKRNRDAAFPRQLGKCSNPMNSESVVETRRKAEQRRRESRIQTQDLDPGFPADRRRARFVRKPRSCREFNANPRGAEKSASSLPLWESVRQPRWN